MASHEELNAFYPLETWRLAQLVLEQNEQFWDARRELVDHYGDEALDAQFIAYLPLSRTRPVIRALHLSVENRVRDFNDKLYELICIRWEWCRRRQYPMIENAEILAAIIDIFGTNGAAALTVLLLKRKFLDKLCNCKVQLFR